MEDIENNEQKIKEIILISEKVSAMTRTEGWQCVLKTLIGHINFLRMQFESCECVNTTYCPKCLLTKARIKTCRELLDIVKYMEIAKDEYQEEK